MARKTHKDRVNELNARLESLSEHHDIPKVCGIVSGGPCKLSRHSGRLVQGDICERNYVRYRVRVHEVLCELLVQNIALSSSYAINRVLVDCLNSCILLAKCRGFHYCHIFVVLV